MKQKIFFRADAGQSIGYGHFIRSLALADMLKDDFDCVFYTQTPTAYQVQELNKVCRFVALPSDNSRFQLFLDELEGNEIVVLDNYFYTEDYQKKVRSKGCKLVCIDDMHDKHYVADAVVNHGFAEDSFFSKEKYTRVFLGPRYALLRAPFLMTGPTMEKRFCWLVCFGGSDENDFTGKAITRILKERPGQTIVAVIGDAYKYIEFLEEKGVTIRRRLSAQEMADLYRSSTNVLCSASSVCYEALACGCRVYAGYYMDNQKEFYESLAKRKHIIPLGNLRDRGLERLSPSSVNETLPLVLGSVRLNYRVLFYGLSFRMVPYPEMTKEESKMVWQVRNLPEIRKGMSDSKPFSLASHNVFMERLKGDPDRVFLAFFDGQNFVGSFNFVGMGMDSSAERGLFLNPIYQGKGIALVLEKLAEEVAHSKGVKYLIAKVKNDNIASIVFHKSAGYVEVDKKDGFMFFKRTLLDHDYY